MYGMWQFGVLAASLLGAGLAIALYLPSEDAMAEADMRALEGGSQTEIDRPDLALPVQRPWRIDW